MNIEIKQINRFGFESFFLQSLQGFCYELRLTHKYF